MTKDRLADIWSGFSQRSSLDLSGTSVDDTPRPSLEREGRSVRDFGTATAAAASARGESAAPDPVAAALTAMHQEMQASGGRGRKARGSVDTPVDHTTPPVSALEKTLLADLAFTRSKTTRTGGDYLTYASERQADWQRRKRRKFLGIF